MVFLSYLCTINNQLNIITMTKEIFEFDDNRFKEQIFIQNKMYDKIKFCFNHLFNHLPINKVNKDNTFNFNKLKFNESKNYNWYFLVNDNIKLLVRQYGTHFIIFVNKKSTNKYGSTTKFSQFNIYLDNNLLPDELSDDYVNDNFLSFEKMLPQIFDIIETNKIGMMWNSLVLVRENFIKIELGHIGRERVFSLDKIIFACDEIFQKYLEIFAENEMVQKLKTLKVGDMFSAYKITKVQTDLVDGYYHGIGLKYVNTNFPNSDETWSDIYSLTRYHYEELFND